MLDGDLPDVVATTVTALHEAGHLEPADRLPYHRTSYLELLRKLPLRRQRLPRLELAADYEVAGTGRHLLVEFDAADRLDYRLWRVSFRRFHSIQFSICALEPVSSVRPPTAVGGRNRQRCASLLVVLPVSESRSTAPARRALARRTKALRARCQCAYQLLDPMHQGPVLSSSLESARNQRAPYAHDVNEPPSIPSFKLVCSVLDLDCNYRVSRFKQAVPIDEKGITKLGSGPYAALWQGDHRSSVTVLRRHAGVSRGTMSRLTQIGPLCMLV